MRRERDQGPQTEKTTQAKTWHLGQQFSGAGTGKRGEVGGRRIVGGERGKKDRASWGESLQDKV